MRRVAWCEYVYDATQQNSSVELRRAAWCESAFTFETSMHSQISYLELTLLSTYIRTALWRYIAYYHILIFIIFFTFAVYLLDSIL